MAKRISDLAKELGISSKVIVDKCIAEGIPSDKVKGHMSALSPGLEATIREWFSPFATAAETVERVDIEKVKASAARPRKPTPFVSYASYGGRELQALSRWGVIAFAARCARRTQPLFELGWNSAPPELIKAVDDAIAMAEVSARAGSSAMFLGHAINAALAADSSATPRAIFSVESARCARDAAMAAKLADESPSEATVLAAKAITEAANAASDATRLADAVSDANESARADYDALVQMTRERQWTNDSPVDPDVLGPLWRLGEPDWWPKQAKSEDPVPPSMVLEFTVPADADQDDVDAKIAELLGHLSQLHHAYGGSGLVIREGMAFRPAQILVPCGPDGDGGGE